MIDSIVLNTIAPLLFVYGAHSGKRAVKEKALRWIEQVTAEKNKITRGFMILGLANKTAFDSQAYVELKKQYCEKRKCLKCAVGNSILRTEK